MEQSILNLTRTESLKMMDVRERKEVWAFCVNSRMMIKHGSCAEYQCKDSMKTHSKCVLRASEVHKPFVDPLHRVSFMISDFSLEKQ